MSEDASRIAKLTRLAGAVRHTERRMRVSAALDALVSVLAISLVVIVAALTLSKVVPGWSPRWTRDVLMAAPFAVFATTVRAFARKLVPLSGAMALDAHHGLSDRVTSALSFAALPEQQRSPLMEVAIDDACELSEKLAPKKAAPIAMPRDSWALRRAFGGGRSSCRSSTFASRGRSRRPRRSIRSCFRPTTSISFAALVRNSPRPTRTPRFWRRWRPTTSSSKI